MKNEPEDHAGNETLTPEQTAELASLSYVDETTPGFQRRRCGRGFIYLSPAGRRVMEPDLTARIKSLVIPPAWEDVWISPKPDGHIQATGRDARGRKQYIYHARWQEVRSRTKYNRLLGFGRVLPGIRYQVNIDLSKRGMTKERAAAFAVRLLDITCMRIGNPEYVRLNQSYGLTTLQDDHLVIEGSRLLFDFPGKGGKRQVLDIYDPRLARIAKKFQDLPGQELIRYSNGNGGFQTVGSVDVNAYLKEITGVDFTAKDFRTWGGTVMTATELHSMGPAESKKAGKRNVTAAIKNTAKQLGNTLSICRKYYVHPAVVAAYATGDLFAAWKREESGGDPEEHELGLEERVVLALLEAQPSEA